MAYLMKTLALIVACSCIVFAQNSTTDPLVPVAVSNANGTELNSTTPSNSISQEAVTASDSNPNMSSVQSTNATNVPPTNTTTMLPSSNATISPSSNATVPPTTTAAPGGAGSVISSVVLMIFAVILCCV